MDIATSMYTSLWICQDSVLLHTISLLSRFEYEMTCFRVSYHQNMMQHDIPLSARLERLALLGEALETEFRELWVQTADYRRSFDPSVGFPVVSIDGNTMTITSRPLFETTMRRETAA